MIAGLLGFRSLIWENKAWRSPSHKDTIWDGPIIWASCDVASLSACPQDEEGHIIIRHGCTCGIHATLWLDEAKHYMTRDNAILVLVEALGQHHFEKINLWGPEEYSSVWQHEYGFTASGVRVVALVNLAASGEQHGSRLDVGAHTSKLLQIHRTGLMVAKKHFQVEIINLDFATQLVEENWARNKCAFPRMVREQYQWFRNTGEISSIFSDRR